MYKRQILDNLIVEDPWLWEKIDRVVRELMACQEPDGYLGTYTPDMRWIGRATEREENNAWDVWVAKYCLLALLRHDQLHSSPAAVSYTHLDVYKRQRIN